MVESLRLLDHPSLHNARLVMGFTGWMDGGDVSTGTIDYLVTRLGASELAEIEPSSFYLYNFPGPMEIASLFRPNVRIEDGIVREFSEPRNVFYYDLQHNLILFSGKEPNLRWREFADLVFAVASQFNVVMVSFVGSVAGLVPHTRDPRIFSSVSDENLAPWIRRWGLTPSNYEGPASFVTYLTTQARRHDVQLASLVAEIPMYVQGKNVKCIAAVVRKLSQIFDINLDFGDLRAASKEFEKRLSETVQERPELAEQILKIEQDYDKEIFDTTVDDDLKEWLQKQGIRLD